jgi:uncharacterized protein (TIGR03435 family)
MPAAAKPIENKEAWSPMRRKSFVLCAAILCLLHCAAHAQVAAPPSFEVATIKPSDPSIPRNMIGVMTTADGIDAQMATLPMLLRVAYGTQEFALDSQITGLPDWTKSQTYDIRAKLSESDLEAFRKLSQREQQHMTSLMLQSLLAERFNLQLHRGARQLPAYDLVIAKGGPKIKPTPDDDPSLRKGEDGKPLQGLVMFMRRGEINIQQETMAEFASLLATQPNAAGRPVIDRTALPGVYTFTLHWSSVSFVNQPPPDSDSASIFTILQEDLGLKLQPSTANLPVLIIDRLDRPTAN